MDQTLVPIRSAWASKINWTQFLAIGSAVAVSAGCSACDLSAQQIAAILTTITVVQGIATWVFRTWFNGSVSPASLPPVT